MTPRSKWRTSIATWASASPSSKPSWMARSRSPFPPLFPPCAFASYSYRSSSSAAPRDIYLRPWHWRWCSPLWRRTCCRAPSSPPWSSTCCAAKPTDIRTSPAKCEIRVTASSPASTRAFKHALNACAIPTAACFGLIVAACAALIPFIGPDFFPQVDAGQIRLHVRAPAGTRIEETESYFKQVEDTIRHTVPPAELSDILDNIGLPYSGYNIALSDTATIGSFDGEILVSLKPDHASTWTYIRDLRGRLNRQFPGLTFFFQPADIVGQILNFGLPAPLDVQVIGPLANAPANYALARQITARMARIPGAVDVHLQQIVDAPELRFNVDRTRADQLGLTQQDVANSLLISLSSNMQLAPNYWINPQNGVDYPIAVQTPEYRMGSTAELLDTPVHAQSGSSTQLLTNVARLERGATASVVNHYNVQPLYDIYANVQDRDLGSVAVEI